MNPSHYAITSPSGHAEPGREAHQDSRSRTVDEPIDAPDVHASSVVCRAVQCSMSSMRVRAMLVQYTL